MSMSSFMYEIYFYSLDINDSFFFYVKPIAVLSFCLNQYLKHNIPLNRASKYTSLLNNSRYNFYFI